MTMIERDEFSLSATKKQFIVEQSTIGWLFRVS